MAGIQSPHDSAEDEKVQCRGSVQVGFALQSMSYAHVPVYIIVSTVFSFLIRV
jgi:hypothetical protein